MILVVGFGRCQPALGNTGRRLDQGGGGRRSNRAAQGIHRRHLVDFNLAAATLFHGVQELVEGGRLVTAVAGGQLLFLAVSPSEFRVVRGAEHDEQAIAAQIALGLAGSHGGRRW